MEARKGWRIGEEIFWSIALQRASEPNHLLRIFSKGVHIDDYAAIRLNFASDASGELRLSFAHFDISVALLLLIARLTRLALLFRRCAGSFSSSKSFRSGDGISGGLFASQDTKTSIFSFLSLTSAMSFTVASTTGTSNGSPHNAVLEQVQKSGGSSNLSNPVPSTVNMERLLNVVTELVVRKDDLRSIVVSVIGDEGRNRLEESRNVVSGKVAAVVVPNRNLDRLTKRRVEERSVVETRRSLRDVEDSNRAGQWVRLNLIEGIGDGGSILREADDNTIGRTKSFDGFNLIVELKASDSGASVAKLDRAYCLV